MPDHNFDLSTSWRIFVSVLACCAGSVALTAEEEQPELLYSTPRVLACAEPTDPLPSEAELKKRFDKLDQQLNKTYGEVIAKMPKDRVSLVREAHRAWIKHRDEGVKFYVSLFPHAERERRRLQFMGDVTAARIEVQAEEWEL